MELFRLGRRYRELQRLRQVIEILAREGFGHFIERLHLPLPARWRRAALPPEPLRSSRSLARRAVKAMQELGPTFVKMGQFLSTRPDVVPPVYIEEFSRLQDQVAPFPSEDARKIVETELGGPMERFFRSFEDVPVASGSIAQVHFAETLEGREVVLKIQRPGISRTISSDLELLRAFAVRLEEYVPESRSMRPVMLVDELGRHLQRELDFLHEGAATQRFHKAFADSDRYHGPEVLWDLTTPLVLTLERIKGRRVAEYMVDATPEERKTLASRLFDLYMVQLFELGFFQADPHPGNIFIDERGRVNIIDFGLTGRVTDELQGDIGTAILAVRNDNLELLTAVLEDLGVFSAETSFAKFESDIRNIIETYYGMPIGRIRISTIFAQINSVARANALFLPRDFVLMLKAMATAGNLARELDPDFDSASAVEPYMRLIVRKKFSTAHLGRSMAFAGFHAGKLLHDAPGNIARILRKLVGGSFSINLEHRGLTRLISDLDRASNRLAFSIIVGSLIVASSLLVRAGVGPHLYGVSIVGIVGYVIAAVLGVWLILGIMRSGRL